MITSQKEIKTDILYRKKNPYSIWKKINKKNTDLNSISDIAAVRIVTKSTRDCYKVLGIILRNLQLKLEGLKIISLIRNQTDIDLSIQTLFLVRKFLKFKFVLVQ